VNIGRGELARPATRRLWKLRTVFCTDFGDSSSTSTSCMMNLMGRSTRIMYICDNFALSGLDNFSKHVREVVNVDAEFF
jgi:hypothetical protein